MNYNNSNYNYEDYFKEMSMNNEKCSYNGYEKYDNKEYIVNLEEGLPNKNLDLKNEYQKKLNNKRNIDMFQGGQNNQYNQELMKSQEMQPFQGIQNYEVTQEMQTVQKMHHPMQCSGKLQSKNLNKVIQIPGQVKKCNQHCNINGKNFIINNKNFFNRYFTRYNHFFINDCNYIKDHLCDCNILHFSSQTIYKGCKYLGSNTVVAKKCNKKFNNNCCFNNIF
ncbi:hypothetical protein [Clostridium sp.]|uniref:hypothetical protein n=1 Tax=Clostridium sp. TaxID=1506 RepID=UPI0025B9FB2B|nr:hypothetical protein [Clostridium sp.]